MKTPSEHDIHAYVDGRLDAERQRAVEVWLAENPERAAEIRAWQGDARELRAALAGADGPAVNSALDPARIRARLRTRRRTRLAIAAAVLVCAGASGAAGWQLRAWRDAEPPMDDALEAYRLFAAEGGLRPDITPRDANDMQDWLDRHLAAAPRLPDLAGAGFRPVGGRLLATGYGPAAMVLYRDGRGGVIGLYARPPSSRGLLPRGERRKGALVAQYGPGGRYNVALVSRADGRDAAIARGALAGSDWAAE